MIIAGNSHVSMFRGGLLLPDEGNREVKINWVGAIRFNQFRLGHPAATRLRQLFAAEDDWKFLCIGGHDIMALCEVMAREGTADSFLKMFTEATEVFKELSAGGRFGWMVCMQHVFETNGLTQASVLNVAKMFNSRLAAWCGTMDIPVIDPTRRYTNIDGTPRLDYFQPDGIHLTSAAGAFYLEDIEKRTGLRVLPKRGVEKPGSGIAVKTEIESFCALVVEELGLPMRDAPPGPPSAEKLTSEILAKINDKLSERGLDAVAASTDFISEGMLDSLELVEVYDFAASLLGQEINFDVDLRALPTADSLAAFLLEKTPKLVPAEPLLEDGLCQEDIFLCLNAEGRGDGAAAWSGDNRIARMGTEIRSRLMEISHTIFGNESSPYGIFFFMLALSEAHEKRFPKAVELATHATRTYHPFNPPRLKTYLSAWASGSSPGTIAQDASPLARAIPGAIPVWEKSVADNIIRTVPIENAGKSLQEDATAIIRQGEEHFSEGRLAEAKLCFWQALETIGMSDIVLNNLGAVFWQEKNVTDALGHFHLALAWNPGNRDAVLNLADALVALGKPEDARAIVQKFLPSEQSRY